MRVLAIETSCDETAAAVVETDNHVPATTAASVRVLSNVVASQAELHARTAGVVPEVAARAHVEAVTFVIEEAIDKATGSGQWAAGGVKLEAGNWRQETGDWKLAVAGIDVIAVTTEPGLRPALVVGDAAARALALAWEKPLIPVNHIAGHIASGWIEPWAAGNGQGAEDRVRGRGEGRVFPIVALVVSGGHTQLWRIDEGFHLKLLGQTRDDAAGEAFDKIARILGLPYPGGAALSALAERGDARAFSFPRPMINSGDLDFSFSGLKTAVMYQVRGNGQQAAGSRRLEDGNWRADVAASAQEAIVDVLVAKTIEAASREGASEVILCGGVAANQRLRARLSEALGKLPLTVPQPVFCTDNAAMIGAAAALGVRIP